MKLNNPYIKDIHTLSAYEVYFDMIKPKNEIEVKGKGFEKLTINEVAVIKTHINKDVQIILNIFFDGLELENVRIFDLYQFQKWLLNELEKLVIKEKRLQVTDNKLIGAGVSDLHKFGVLNTIDTIAQRYRLDPRTVGEWNYFYAFNIMEKITVETRIQKRINKKNTNN